MTVSADGVYWNPLVSPSDGDMLVTRQMSPPAEAIECIQQKLGAMDNREDADRAEFL